MLRKHSKSFAFLNVLLDYLLVVASYVLALLFSNVSKGFDESNIAFDFKERAFIFALLFIILYLSSGVYRPIRRLRTSIKLQRIIICNIVGILLISFSLYFFRAVDFSRRVLFFYFLISSFLVSLKHGLVGGILHYLRSGGRNLRHIVLVGSGMLALQYVQDLQKHKEFGFVLQGSIGDNPIVDIPYLGPLEEIDALLSNTSIDEVVVCPSEHNISRIDDILFHVEKSGIPCSVIPSFNNSMSSKVSMMTVGNTKLITLRDNPLDHPFNAFVKRAEDVILSLFFIVITSPIMLIATVGVKLSSPGPVLFKQQRVGKGRKLFNMLKFRSMRINAASDTAWSKNEDPRKTKFGSFIRKTSIDELPQFFNVLKGDMSIIGPRPEIPHYVDAFKEIIPKYMVKHQVRPGITGWAQVNGFRGDTSIEGRINCDIYYIENWSLWFDVKIVFRTVFGGMVNKEKIVK